MLEIGPFGKRGWLSKVNPGRGNFFKLQQQGRAAEAKALIGTLAPKAMKEPRSALYYSVFLIVSQRPDEAAKCMRLPGIRSLPLEERPL